jgi:hypothetical protein
MKSGGAVGVGVGRPGVGVGVGFPRCADADWGRLMMRTSRTALAATMVASFSFITDLLGGLASGWEWASVGTQRAPTGDIRCEVTLTAARA